MPNASVGYCGHGGGVNRLAGDSVYMCEFSTSNGLRLASLLPVLGSNLSGRNTMVGV